MPERFATYQGRRYPIPDDVEYTQEGVAQAYREGRLVPSEPPSFPDVRGPIQHSLGVASGVLGKASRAAQQGLEAGGAVSPWIAGLLNPIPEDIAGASSMLLPSLFGGGAISGPLKRIAAAGITGAGMKQLESGDPAASATRGVQLAGGQAVGEALTTPFRLLANMRTANRIRRELADDLESRDKRIAFDKAMHEGITTLEDRAYKDALTARKEKYATDLWDAKVAHQRTEAQKTARYEQMKQAQAQRHAAETTRIQSANERANEEFSERGAQHIAETFKTMVPAWTTLPSDTRGLLDMVYGKGQRLISERFDQAMKEIAEKARGQTIHMLEQDAAALKLRPTQWIDRPEWGKGVKEALIDAGAAAEAATGKWASNPATYRRVVQALDAANIGDKAARAEYRAAQALISFADKSQMLKGERFNPDLAQAAFTKLSKVNELRRRGLGNIFEGSISEATRSGRPILQPMPPEPMPILKPPKGVFPGIPKPPKPAAPSYRSPPVEPPMPSTLRERGVVERTFPKIPWWEGAILSEAPFAAFGHHGFGVPGAAGAVAAHALSGRPVVTQAPNPAVIEALFRVSPMLVNAYLQKLGP